MAQVPRLQKPCQSRHGREQTIKGMVSGVTAVAHTDHDRFAAVSDPTFATAAKARFAGTAKPLTVSVSRRGDVT